MRVHIKDVHSHKVQMTDLHHFTLFDERQRCQIPVFKGH